MLRLVCKFFLFVAGLAGLGYYWLPSPPLLDGISFSQAVYDDSHHLLRLNLSKDGQYRVYQPLATISSELIEATLLQEDHYFFQHPGLNPIAAGKAFWQTYILKSRRMGASTITMQLARIRFHINSKTLKGKFTQILRALEIERHYSKQQILEAYLNLAPYGGNVEGIGAASLIYFQTSASQLNLAQALTLAVIPQNPNSRNAQNTQLKSIRNKLFLRWLEKHPADIRFQSYFNLPLVMTRSRNLPFIAPQFVNNVLYFSADKQIETTLNLALQKTVERVTKLYLKQKRALGINNAAVILVDTRDMEIKAALGSADFFNARINGQINGLDIKRSPGSTLKPFIYALALDQGLIHPNTVLKDVPSSFNGYNPENFDYDFMGPIKAKEALILSRNIPAIFLASKLHNPSLFQLLALAEISQLKSESYYGLALTLGGAELSVKELAGLYAMLANGGVWRPLRLLKDAPVYPGKRLISPEASFLVLDMLKDTARPDTAVTVGHNLPVAWKTGTSSGFRDAWTAGVFGPYVLTVWLGNFDNHSNQALIGKNIAAPLFFALVEAITHEKKNLNPTYNLSANLNLSRVAVCKASGLLPTRYCKERELTWFIPGKSPIKKDTIFREVAINKKTGLRTCHYNEDTYFKIYEFWPSDILKIFRQAGIHRQIPPPMEQECNLTTSNNLAPQITSPQANVSYVIRGNTTQKTIIPLAAVVDADVKQLYWFINDRFIGQTAADKPLLWTAISGHYVIRVIDEHGLADARDLIIRIAS